MPDIGISADRVKIIIEAEDKTSDKLDTISGKLDKLTGLGKTVAGVGMAAVGAATAAVGGIIAKTVPQAMDFEQAMRNVNSIAQLNEDEFQKLTDDVLDFSMTTRASATDVAGSLYNVVSAGFGAAEGFDIMKASSRAAGAGLADTTSTSQLLIAALRSYQLPVSEADRLTDVFLQTVNEGITTLPELASGMGRVLPVAASLGIPIEELGFSLARATQTGLSTDEAFTRINATYTSLLSPSEDLQSAIEDLGYASGYDLVQQTGGALGALNELKKGGFMDTTDAVAALFPNVRALGGVLALTTDDANLAAGAIQDFGERSEGAVSRAREQQYASFSAQLELLKSKFEVIAIKVGTAVLPILSTLGGLITTYVVPAVDTFAGIWEKVWAWISDVLEKITEFGWTLDDLFTTFEDGSTVWEGFFEALGFSEEKSRELGQAINDIYTFVTDLIDKIIEVVTPIWDWISANIELKDLLIALGILLAVGVVSAIVAVITAVGPLLLVIAGLTAIVALARTAWEENWGGIQEKARAVMDWLTVTVPQVWEWIKETITTISNAIRDFWDAHGEEIMATAKRVWEWIKETIKTIINIIKDIVEFVANNLRDFWDAHGEEIMEIAGRVWNWIKTEIERLINLIKSIVETVSNALRDFWRDHGEQIKDIAKGAYEWIKDKVEFVLGLIEDIFALFKLAQEGKWYEFGQKLREIVEEIHDKIKEIFNNMFEAIKQIYNDAVEALMKIIAQFVLDIIAAFTKTDWGKVGGSVIDGIKKGIEGGIQKIKDVARRVAKAALDAAMGFLHGTSPSKLFQDVVGKSITDGLALGIEKGIPNVTRATELLLSAATVAPTFAMAGTIAGPVTGARSPLLPAAGNVTNYNYTINAQYSNQDERELIQDIRMLQLLRG